MPADPGDLSTRHCLFYLYKLLKEDNDWEIDLKCLEGLIDQDTVAIIVNNPSNPCGSVYSREHLIDIINLAERYKLPIIADEVYGDMVSDRSRFKCFVTFLDHFGCYQVFPGEKFYYMSELSSTVPILSCNSLSKRFILPGWRFGWVAIHDPMNYLGRKSCK